MSARAAVLGAGAWGTALANVLARKGIATRLWSYERDVADGINAEHRNARYLEGVALHPGLGDGGGGLTTVATSWSRLTFQFSPFHPPPN